MLPASQSSHDNPNNEVGINSVPEHISKVKSLSPCLPELCDKDDKTCYTSRLYMDAISDEEPSSTLSKTEAVVMSEVADFVQTRHCDEFWAPRNAQPERLPPTANQILYQIKDPRTHRPMPTSGAESFESLLHAIALQLLASCHTVLPASSACHLPLFQQRTRPQYVSALRLHSQHRFEPAAGHHARASSETTCWPGLYAGPPLEEKLAEMRSIERRTKRKSDFVPHLVASGWLDGPFQPEIHRVPAGSDSPSSSSSIEEPGFFSRLICQASVPRDPRRRHNTVFTRHSFAKGKQSRDSLSRQVTPSKSSKTHLKPLQSLTSRAVQRIPSAFRLRRTQSAPRIPTNDVDTDVDTVIPLVIRPRIARKHSSNPSISSPLDYSFEIPDIRRISATPAGSQFKKSISTSLRVCGRGDMIVSIEPSPRNESYTSYEQTNSMPTRAQISVILSPSVISPLNISDIALSRRESPSPVDYFTSVHAATHVDDEKDHDIADEDDLREEREDAGPSIKDCPVLEEIFAKIHAPDDEYTSDSDTENFGQGRRRKTLLGDLGSAECEVVEKFRRKCLEQAQDEDESDSSVIHLPRS